MPKHAIATARNVVSQSKSRRSRFSIIATIVLSLCYQIRINGRYKSLFRQIGIVNSPYRRRSVCTTESRILDQRDDGDLRFERGSETDKPCVVLVTTDVFTQ